MRPRNRHLFWLAMVLWLAGCTTTRTLMPTPSLYVDSGRELFPSLASPLQSTEVELLYVTDRGPEKDEDGKLRYGFQRSESAAFGTTVVDLGANVSWDELLEASRTDRRLRRPELRLGDVTELARLSPTPVPFAIEDGEVIEDPDALAKRREAVELFRDVLNQRLALTSRK